MATYVVPGADPKNYDKLAVGCWAEHDDGSLIYVKEITPSHFVVFDVYDPSDGSPTILYTDRMPLERFNVSFSFELKRSSESQIKWLWHDKTPFPWDRVLNGLHRPHNADKIQNTPPSAAARISSALKLSLAGILTPSYLKTLREGSDSDNPGISQTIFSRIKNAIGRLKG